MKQPLNEPFSLYVLVAGVIGQVGCLLFLTIGGALAIGLVLDQVLGTKPLFVFAAILGSVPLNIWLIFQYTRRKTRSLQAPEPQKEDTISE